ncbi:MAG TPA: hypothetical protein PLX66_02110 [Bacilli bacterium]|nr:hypothetical protein [Bacilli bacterium]
MDDNSRILYFIEMEEGKKNPVSLETANEFLSVGYPVYLECSVTDSEKAIKQLKEDFPVEKGFSMPMPVRSEGILTYTIHMNYQPTEDKPPIL